MNALKRIRLEKGLTLRELEMMSGVSKWTITQHENGRVKYVRGVRHTTVHCLAAALNVPKEDLVEVKDGRVRIKND